MTKVIGDDKDSAKRQDLIRRQWQEFSKKLAFKELMEYIDLQDYFAVKGAKGPINTFDANGGDQLNFDPIKAANLLQRSVGYDIVKLYIEGYVENTTPSDVS
jgi:hypothetical protein